MEFNFFRKIENNPQPVRQEKIPQKTAGVEQIIKEIKDATQDLSLELDAIKSMADDLRSIDVTEFSKGLRPSRISDLELLKYQKIQEIDTYLGAVAHRNDPDVKEALAELIKVRDGFYNIVTPDLHQKSKHMMQ